MLILIPSVLSVYEMVYSSFRFGVKFLESRVTQERNLPNLYLYYQNFHKWPPFVHSHFQNTVIYCLDSWSFPEFSKVNSLLLILSTAGSAKFSGQSIPQSPPSMCLCGVSHLLPSQAQLLSVLSLLKNEYL